MYRIFDSVWTQRTDRVSSRPDEGSVQADSRRTAFALQVESKAGSRNPDPTATDQRASSAGTETTAPQQFRRFLFVWLYHWFPSVLGAIVIVRPETIIRWHRAGFRAYWRWRSRIRVGRPKVSAELRTLIGAMSRANPLWGAPHIHGELLKLGFEVAQSTVARYMCRHSRPPSQGWRTFLSNHADGIAAVDFFVLPTIAFRILYCLVIIKAWTTNLGVVWCDGKPDCGLDLAPDHRGFPMGLRAAIPHSGSGHLLRASLRAAAARHGHSRSADCVPITLAKPLR